MYQQVEANRSVFTAFYLVAIILHTTLNGHCSRLFKNVCVEVSLKFYRTRRRNNEERAPRICVCPRCARLSTFFLYFQCAVSVSVSLCVWPLRMNFKPRIVIWNARNHQYRTWNAFSSGFISFELPCLCVQSISLPLLLLLFPFLTVACPKFTIFLC